MNNALLKLLKHCKHHCIQVQNGLVFDQSNQHLIPPKQLNHPVPKDGWYILIAYENSYGLVDVNQVQFTGQHIIDALGGMR